MEFLLTVTEVFRNYIRIQLGYYVSIESKFILIIGVEFL